MADYPKPSTFHLRPGTQDEMCWKEVVLENEYRLPDTIPGDAVVLDIGANIGTFAHAVLARGAAKVICYEPDPENYKLLEKNLEPWGDKVILCNAAVVRSDERRDRVPYALAGPGQTAMGRTVMDRDGSINVPAMPFDLALQQAQHEAGGPDKKIYLVKIDAEGVEFPVLLTSRLLDTTVEHLVGESHEFPNQAIMTPDFFVAGHDDYSHFGLVAALRARGWETDIVRRPDTQHINAHFFARRMEPRKPAKILIFRFPGGHSEHPDCTDWVVKQALWAEKEKRESKRIEDQIHAWIADTPVTMSRNAAVQAARDVEADLLVLLDSDMKFDMYENAPPFLETSFDFWWNHAGPLVVASPYCGPPPMEMVYVFRWRTFMNQTADPNCKLDMYTREEAAEMKGIKPCAALPTGLMMIDMKTFDQMEPPYFYYEYKDPHCAGKASTEDVTFSRDAHFADVPVYCNWDCWSGHWKRRLVGKPQPMNLGSVPVTFRQTVERDLARGVDFNRFRWTQDKTRGV